MRIHVLTGCRELLRPEILLPDTLADLTGPGICVVKAYWLARNYGDEYHDFLQDEPGDRRTMVMAEAVKDGYGKRFEPLLVFPELLEESKTDSFPDAPLPGSDRRSQYSALCEILESGYFREVNLYGLALSSTADPDGSWAVPAAIVPGRVREQIDRLPAAFADFVDPGSIKTHVIEVTPQLPDFNVLYNNALCSEFARRIEPRMLDSGWNPDTEALAGALSSIVSGWNGNGMFMATPLGNERFEKMTDLLYDRLLNQ